MTPSDILAWRQAAYDRGYRPVALLSGQKHTLAPRWQIPGPRPERVAHTHENTGILCAGLRAIDVDVDGTGSALFACVTVTRTLGDAPYRTRPASPRRAYLYRASEGEPGKVAIRGKLGGIEVLGTGQQLHAHGLHPSGAMLEWPNGGPADISFADLPTVTEEQVASLLERLRPIIGAPEPEPLSTAFCGNPSKRIEHPDPWARKTLAERATEIAGLACDQDKNLFRIAVKTGHDIKAHKFSEQAAFDALMSGAARMRNLDPKWPWTREELARKIRRGFAYAGRAA